MVMKMKYQISPEQYAEILAAKKANRDKQIDARLNVLVLRYEGNNLAEIAKETGFHRSHVSGLIRQYFEEGLTAISEKHYKGNRRNLSLEEEREFLEKYRQQAEQGQLVSIQEMERDYEERVGHPIGSGQIYRVLKRQGWRKVMPRSRHPKKASEEVIATSKKLNPRSKN
ncbi:MAG: helix-turn-helix domain-containing protein [Clostridia bacterium]|nr:helix-turn-helix domain-containing protein [Clostridia bacterium]